MGTSGRQAADTSLPNLGAPSRKVQNQTDQELLLAVGRYQDRQAFDEIYARHQKRAYNLALHLTSNPTTAEDAVQVAMLRVWKYARTYKEEGGSATGWLLRVFAQGSLHLARKERREMKQERPLFSPFEEHKPLGQQAEISEALPLLGDEVRRLPNRDRKIIALRYGAGFTQAQIAAELHMTQRAISYRNKIILHRLHAILSQTGFAAALPLLEGLLGTALLEGRDPPAGLQARFDSRLDTATQAASSGARAKSAGAALWAGAILVLAAAPSTGWWSLRNSESKAPLPDQRATAPASGTSFGTVAQESGREPKTWHFNQPGDTAGLALVAGSEWHWVPGGGPDGSGCMETDTPSFSIALPVPGEKLPLQVTCRFQNRPPSWDSGGWAKWLIWTSRKAIADFHYIAPQDWHSASPNPAWRETRFLVTERFVVMQSQGTMHLIAVERGAGARLWMGLQGKFRIDDLAVAPVDPKEIPNVSKYLAALDKIPVEKRVGIVELPELPSPVPGKKAAVQFVQYLDQPEP